MTRVNRNNPVVVSLPPGGAGQQTGKNYLSIGQLIEKSQKLRVVAHNLKLQSFNDIIQLAGAEISHQIFRLFVAYHDDFSSVADLSIFFFASKRFLLKEVKKEDKKGKLTEIYPVKVDSPEAQCERDKYLKAVRGMARAFAKLELSADESQSFVEQVGPVIFPLFVKKPSDAEKMLSVSFGIDLKDKSGLEKLFIALKAASKNQPDHLEAEVARLLRGK